MSRYHNQLGNYGWYLNNECWLDSVMVFRMWRCFLHQNLKGLRWKYKMRSSKQQQKRRREIARNVAAEVTCLLFDWIIAGSILTEVSLVSVGLRPRTDKGSSLSHWKSSHSLPCGWSTVDVRPPARQGVLAEFSCHMNSWITEFTFDLWHHQRPMNTPRSLSTTRTCAVRNES